MKAEINKVQITPNVTLWSAKLYDVGTYVGSTIGYDTENEVKEALRKYFPAFKLEGDKQGLPDAPILTCPKCGKPADVNTNLYEGYCKDC